MDRKRQKPADYDISLKSRLYDAVLNEFSKKIENLKQTDFILKKNFDEIEKVLETSIQKETLKLCRFLYCMKYYKEMFLHIGVIIESLINSIAEMYLDTSTNLPNFSGTEESKEIFLKRFIDKNLSDKANDLEKVKMLGQASSLIKPKIHSLRILRNFGGHDSGSTGIIKFFQNISNIIEKFHDDELNSVFLLIKEILEIKSKLFAQ